MDYKATFLTLVQLTTLSIKAKKNNIKLKYFILKRLLNNLYFANYIA